MWIYITHFRIFPPLERGLPLGVAYVLTLLAGVLIWRTVDVVDTVARRTIASRGVPKKALPSFRRTRRDERTLAPAVAAPHG